MNNCYERSGISRQILTKDKLLKPRLAYSRLGNRTGETQKVIETHRFNRMSGNGGSSEQVILEFRSPGSEPIASQDYLQNTGLKIESEEQLDGAYERVCEDAYAALLFNVSRIEGPNLIALGQLRKTYPRAIFVFARNFETIDRILAYELGADDFLTDQLSARELTTRMRAGIRRYLLDGNPANDGKSVLTRAGIHLDSAARTVRLNEAEIDLTRAEFDLLAMLMRKPRQVFTRNLLLESLTQNGYQALDRTVDVHIASIRRKLGDSPQKPRFIRTARGVGYSFVQ